jgi:hypothetical protein
MRGYMVKTVDLVGLKGRVAPEVLNRLMKEGIADWEGLRNKLAPPSEMGWEEIANCNYVGESGRPMICVKSRIGMIYQFWK